MNYLVLLAQPYLSGLRHGLTNGFRLQRFSRMVSVSLGLSVISLCSLGLEIAQASHLSSVSTDQRSAQQTIPRQPFSFSRNFDPPGDGRPDTSRGSGARTGSCEAPARATQTSDNMDMMDSPRIRALMPPGNFGLTLHSHPTIFIDFDGAEPPFVVLRVEDEAGTYRERVMLPVDPDRSIQGFTLPRDLPPLEVGKNYRWLLLVVCDGHVNPNHPLFSGWVQRVAISETTTLIQQQPITEQVSWYTNHGYWYDTVMTLHETLHRKPEDDISQALWLELLDYIDTN